MAPLSLNDRINLSASIGTWLGSFFTAIGLIAVLSQLRAILVSNRNRQERFVSRAAGIWSSYFNLQALQVEGTVEQAAPALAGWIQTQYLNDGITQIMQSGTRVAGTSNWSKLFAHCSISPSQLNQCGGPNSLILPVTINGAPKRTPTQADVRIEDGKLEYGFSAAEFAALLIVAGLSPSVFTAKGTSSSVGYLGTMHLANHGPLSQTAHFDPRPGNRIMAVELARLVYEVPVQAAIHVALGILKLSPRRGERQCIVLPSHHLPWDRVDCSNPQQFRRWIELPSADQLRGIRCNIKELALVSEGNMISYSSRSASFIECEDRTMSELIQISGLTVSSQPYSGALLAAYAVDALQPWALLPVAPKHFVDGFKDILGPFVAAREETLGELSKRLRQSPPEGVLTVSKSGWRNAEEQIGSLSRIGDIKTEYFCGSSSFCAYYYQAMVKVFSEAGLHIRTVRRRLAAEVAYQFVSAAAPYPTLEDHVEEKGQRTTFISALIDHLGGE
ncbi:MAG: hypothetical protein Q9213_000668 [Squamulea squamosa]